MPSYNFDDDRERFAEWCKEYKIRLDLELEVVSLREKLDEANLRLEEATKKLININKLAKEIEGKSDEYFV